MKLVIKKSVFQLQKILLWASYLVGRLRSNSTMEKDVWIVGVHEISGLLKDISAALPKAISVSLYNNCPFYSYAYDYELTGVGLFGGLKRCLSGPILLGFLSARCKQFLYLGPSGFLLNDFDGRRYEFSFLKDRTARVACIFTGSEIRSYKLLEEFSSKHDIDVITTYQRYTKKGIESDKSEKFRKMLAEVADQFADDIVNPAVDQMSYIKRPTHPFMYFYPDEKYDRNEGKFENLDVIRILHAPSSPIIKGTPLIRAAIKKLKTEGYAFDYVELNNASHDIVLNELRRSHIVLNQFYAFVPGVFGIEAMANCCALMTSADEEFEPSLGKGANQAWCVTHYWEVYDNLKMFLDNKLEIQVQANKGFDWALAHCSYSASARTLSRVLGQR